MSYPLVHVAFEAIYVQWEENGPVWQLARSGRVEVQWRQPPLWATSCLTPEQVEEQIVEVLGDVRAELVAKLPKSHRTKIEDATYR